ncbi:MAG TPA: pirin family protein [Blastocatellia bacterium]|nr:pirin family protein [Blastocatellia bacterium]
MIAVRPASERGHLNFGWLDTYHSFSFGEYYDYNHMGFSDLRVINEDYVSPGRGFPTHPHRDMEIITYVLDGALEHRDSMGTGSVIRPGDVQRMSAGSGITHSEFNHSKTELVHLLQIWIMPNKHGVKPSYEQKYYSADEKRGNLRLVASPDGSYGSVTINQDAKLFATILSPGQELTHKLENGRSAWIQVARGNVTVDGKELHHGDGAAVTDQNLLNLIAIDEAEVLLFDLAE